MCAPSSPTDTESTADSSGSSSSSSNNDNLVTESFDDPHDIHDRFVAAHQEHLENAVLEIKNGQKESGWIWYLLPMTPVVVQSVEQGCEKTRKYALSGDPAFQAYLQHSNGMLRDNSIKVIKAIHEQLLAGKTIQSLMGEDDYRSIKSMELFVRVGQKIGDDELVTLCQTVIDLHLDPEAKAVDPNDPHDIEDRFVFQHNKHFPRALREIQGGQKESCWIWFLIPCAPYVVNGVQKGSPQNKKFALHGGDDAVVAYLQHRDGMLRDNYVTLIKAIRDQMKKNKRTLRNLLGVLDDVKTVSSMKLFARIGRERTNDQELVKVCEQVLEMHEKQMQKAKRKSDREFRRRQQSMEESSKKKFFGVFRLGLGSSKEEEAKKQKAFRRTWHGTMHGSFE